MYTDIFTEIELEETLEIETVVWNENSCRTLPNMFKTQQLEDQIKKPQE